MARYFAEIEGQTGRATRLGNRKSGIRAHVRGWNLGIRISGATVYEDDSHDEFRVAITGGSHDTGTRLYLGSVSETADGWEFIPSDQMRERIIAEHYASKGRVA